MTNLTDSQTVLISTASQREDGSVLPLPASISPGGGATKAVVALLKRGLADERESRNTASVHRADGDTRCDAFLPPAGAEIIKVELPTLAVGSNTAVRSRPQLQMPSEPDGASNLTLRTKLRLKRAGRAVRQVKVMGWQPAYYEPGAD